MSETDERLCGATRKVGDDGTTVYCHLYAGHSTEQHRAAYVRESGVVAGAEWTAPSPAPRTVTVDADDLDLVLRMSAYDGHDGLEQYARLRAALDTDAGAGS